MGKSARSNARRLSRRSGNRKSGQADVDERQGAESVDAREDSPSEEQQATEKPIEQSEAKASTDTEAGRLDQGVEQPHTIDRAPDCQVCKSNNTTIYCTRGAVQYVKCRHCNHTWSKARKFVPER